MPLFEYTCDKCGRTSRGMVFSTLFDQSARTGPLAAVRQMGYAERDHSSGAIRRPFQCLENRQETAFQTVLRVLNKGGFLNG